MGNHTYIVFHKKNPTVLRRLAHDGAVKSYWSRSPADAWRDRVNDTDQRSPMDPSDYIVVGGYASDDADAHGAHRVTLDWTDTHEAYGIEAASVA